MTDYRTLQMQDSEAARRALDHLVSEQEQRDAAEQAEREQAEQQARAQFAMQLHAQEQTAVERMAALAPRYREREELAKRAVAALAEFYAVEARLRDDLEAIDAGTVRPLWTRLDRMQTPARWAALRARAGLSEQHRAIDLAAHSQAEKIGATAVLAIVGDVVRPGAVVVGTRTKTFDV